MRLFSKKIFMMSLVLGFVFIGVDLAVAMTRNEAIAGFVKAAQDYQKGNFAKAVEEYQSVIDAGWESGPLYYNLANTWSRLGKKGQAILNYERAMQLMPRDSDLLYNYRYVKSRIEGSQTSDGLGGTFQRLMDRHIRFYTVGEMVILITVLVILMIILALIGKWWRWPVKRLVWLQGVLGIILMIFLTGVLLKVQYQSHAVFVVEGGSAKFEPKDDATDHFVLNEGDRVTILRKDFGWLKIQLPSGVMGWIPEQRVEAL